MEGKYGRRGEVEKHVLTELPFFAIFAFVAGALAPFYSGALASYGSLLPEGDVLAFLTLLLGSVLFYGYGSLFVSFAAGVRLAPHFEPLDGLFSWYSAALKEESFEKVIAEPPLPPQAEFLGIVLALALGALLCVAASWIGNAVYRSPGPKDALVAVGVFAGCAAGLVYYGVW